MPDFVQYFLFMGFAGLMLLLRLDARRFGAAEWDDAEGDRRLWLSRATWYVAGLGLALVTFALHPAPVADLNLVFAPDQGSALTLGLVYAALGIAAAFGLALLIVGRLDFPEPARYAGGVLCAVGTAFFDEFLFRGVILGLLLVMGLPGPMAVLGSALIYAGAVRASLGRSSALAVTVAFVMGLAGGALVLATAGIGAAFMGHAATRFALFMTMGRSWRPATEPAAVVSAVRPATADSGAWVIPPLQPGQPSELTGRRGSGPVRPA